MNYHQILGKIQAEPATRAKLFILKAIREGNLTPDEIACLFSDFTYKLKDEVQRSYKKALINHIEKLEL